MPKELQDFYNALTELLRVRHGDDLTISMRDHQRVIRVSSGSDTVIEFDHRMHGTIPSQVA